MQQNICLRLTSVKINSRCVVEEAMFLRHSFVFDGRQFVVIWGPKVRSRWRVI
jgi:hypothetical protein